MPAKRVKSPHSKPIRLLIADDHAIVRFGLTTLLQYENDIEVVAQAEDGESAVEAVRRHRPDVAVVDLAMPGIGGLEAIHRIRESVPETKIVVFTSFGTSEDLARAIELGVEGITLKDAGNDRLLKTIRAVVAGESVIPRELRCTQRPEQPVDLSDQEREVLAAIARGLTNKDIAAMTGLSKDIAKHLISELFAKLGVANRAEAAALAIRKQLVKM